MTKNIADDTQVKAAQSRSENPWVEMERKGRLEHKAKSEQANRTKDVAARTRLQAAADLAEARANYAEGKLRALR